MLYDDADIVHKPDLVQKHLVGNRVEKVETKRGADGNPVVRLFMDTGRTVVISSFAESVASMDVRLEGKGKKNSSIVDSLMERSDKIISSKDPAKRKFRRDKNNF